ncbi:SseB family protein [Gordonia sp. PKS22-38]|uniref:SseB family protein n=1 Tax=Gordonia prachuapensis TaxID=3115651 RepID=A0ABU7MV79_9ACTN|nr:SseB family protein [Gordonia sp. PKS22-38]
MGAQCDDLVDEIDAFYQGFGQPAALIGALRTAVLLVPVSEAGCVWRTVVDGVGWIGVFTSEREYAKFLAARGEYGPAKYHAMLGSRIVDDVTLSFDDATGIVIDPCGDRPMPFPQEASSWAS